MDLFFFTDIWSLSFLKPFSHNERERGERERQKDRKRKKKARKKKGEKTWTKFFDKCCARGKKKININIFVSLQNLPNETQRSLITTPPTLSAVISSYFQVLGSHSCG